MLDKLAVARALREIGLLLELKGENPFKVRAYGAGARALEESTGDFGVLVEGGKLTDLRGIGEALAKKIAELHVSGHTALLDRLRAEFPPGTLELLEVPELGPKKLIALREALGITSLAELEDACRAGRVRNVAGFGERARRASCSACRAWRSGALRERGCSSRKRRLWEKRSSHTSAASGWKVSRWPASCAGKVETVGELSLLADTRTPGVVLERLTSFPGVAEVLARTPAEASVRLTRGVGVRLGTTSPEAHGPALLFATGSARHVSRLGALAQARDLTLGPLGLARGGTAVPAPSEEAVYSELGLPFIPPELREDEGELDAAKRGALPGDLVREVDLRGLVHCHTRSSDGRATLLEMALAADALGAEYLTVTDHSGAAAYAGGLDAERLAAQGRRSRASSGSAAYGSCAAWRPTSWRTGRSTWPRRPSRGSRWWWRASTLVTTRGRRR